MSERFHSEMLTSNNRGDEGASRSAPVLPQVKKRRRRRREGEEDEPVLRTTCDNCTSAKVKCNGGTPCSRCANKSISCEYTYKKRCGPKRRKGPAADTAAANARGSASDSEGLLASYPRGSVGGAGGARRPGGPGGMFDLASMSIVLGKEEVEYVRVFMHNVNSFMPLTTMETMRQAATPKGQSTPPRGSGSQQHPQQHSQQQRQDDEEEDQLRHARKAVLHGAIAVGAEFLEREEASQSHAQIARQEIKECFDAAESELVGAYLILALYWMHQMDSLKISRYIGLAHQSNGIITKPPSELVASLTFISVVLFDAKVVPSVGCRVDHPGPTPVALSARNPPAVACQDRLLRILSFVLLAIHNRADPSSAASASISTGPWDPNALARLVDQAKLLIDKTEVPSDMARCIIVVLQAYFLLLQDDHRGAVVITEPLADLVADNPLVLYFPIVWSSVASVHALMESAVRTIAMERLGSAMEPRAVRLASASQESVIGRELRSVFSKKGHSRVVAGAAGTAAVPEVEENVNTAETLLLRQKAQTSSLNVTAEDILARNGGDLLALEPSPAPARRGLPLTSITSRAGSSDSGKTIRAESSTLAQSSLAVAEGETLRASSAPISRRGSLTRVSQGFHFPFERSPASMLQLDLRPFSEEFIEGSPAPAVATTGDAPVIAPVPGMVSLAPGADSPAPAIAVGDAVETGIPVDRGRGQGGGSGGGSAADNSSGNTGFGVGGREADADDEMMLEGIDPKLLPGARDLLSHTVQASFNAKAPVSLEQVDRNLARLTVSTASDGRPGLERRINSLDLEAAADQLLATKSSFIS